MNHINPKKLAHSKWTAVIPTNKEKHFIVSETEFDETGAIVSCTLEAVLTKRATPIDWQILKDDSHWVHGWQ